MRVRAREYKRERGGGGEREPKQGESEREAFVDSSDDSNRCCVAACISFHLFFIFVNNERERERRERNSRERESGHERGGSAWRRGRFFRLYLFLQLAIFIPLFISLSKAEREKKRTRRKRPRGPHHPALSLFSLCEPSLVPRGRTGAPKKRGGKRERERSWKEVHLD